MSDDEFEYHKLTLFDQLASIRVRWQTDATYAVLVWHKGDAVQTAETAAPPRWVAVEALKSITPLNSHVAKLLKAPGFAGAVIDAATAARNAS